MVKILPSSTSLSQPYWDGAQAHTLLFQECRACGERWHPPMPRCPACYASSFDWLPSAGNGVVYTFTVVHHATHPAFADRVPYVVAVIELDEGPRIVMNVAGQVQCGTRVRVVFEALTADITLPQAVAL